MALTDPFPPPPPLPTAFPPPPPTGVGDVHALTITPPCPPGTHPGMDGGCVTPGGETTPTPTPTPTTPTPTTPTPTPGTCPPGQVWRADTNACEAPDARSNAGQETCKGPMPTCPGGQGVWCDFDTAEWKCAPNQFSDDELCRVKNNQRVAMGKAALPCPQSGGAGGGSGGRPAPTGLPTGPGSSTNFGGFLEQIIRGSLNSPSRYTPEALQAMYGEIARQASGSIQRGTAAARANAAQRGMSRAGSTDAAIAAVRAGAEAQRGQAVVGVQTAKINADFQDKMSAIDRGQKYLDGLRDSEYRYALMGEQRRQFDANLALGYASLSQQRSMLQMQLQSNWDMLRAQQGFLLLSGGV
jgi:hypothetical protein